MQTKRQSLAEAIINIFIGYIINFIAQLVIYPIVGVQASYSQIGLIGLLFTGISLLRMYLIRRYFNKK